MGLIAVILIGILAGWLAGKIMRGRGYGVLMDILLGLVGAVIGSWVFAAIGIHEHSGLGTIAMATVGAVILVALTRVVRGEL